MKLSNKFLASILCLSLAGGLTACGASDKKDSSNKDEKKTEQKVDNKAVDEVGGVSLKNPIKVDKQAKTVTVLSSVNGKYFTENTRHASVQKDGSNGTKSVFTAYATPEDFYNGLIAIGGKPGNNMTPDNAMKTHVEGSKIKATVKWNGSQKDYDINEVIKDSNGKKIDFRFGGNLERAKTKKTGCLACLDSCPVGIISNTTYTMGAVEKRGEVKFNGNQDILPEDGTYVAITYSIAE
ncbi:YdjY domain-containing protein [Peptostreptococcus equinus]|uniref:YdjY domain-containing protein n=1 Tax=Peptostreptococcus equinus TaxID=3003601 RepID=A0ABY7JU78_9FIRM|nr:YdjY domain-containing protein [Peptostreptococcus sp. CBA3647]WAW15633.1 YdjY domain-containing protein [Peptostreptococcus sp. CBA3647]